MNPTQWLQAYATAVRAAGGDTSVMANYLPIMLTPTAMNWLTSLAPEFHWILGIVEEGLH